MPNDPVTTPTPEPVATPPATDPAATPPAAEPPKLEGTEPAKVDPALDTRVNPFKVDEIKFSAEGVTIDPEMGNAFTAIVNEHGLSRDVVAKLVGLQEKVMLANSEAGSRSWTETQEQWAAEVQKDPELGGQKWPEVQGQIGQLLDTYGSPELREAFDLTGAGNNPHVVRFMSKVAKVLNESGFISANPGGGGAKSAADILYPNQGKT
jgi:hypothetical protein